MAGCGGGGTSTSTATTTAAQGLTGATSSTTTSTSPANPASSLTAAQGVRAAMEAALASSDPGQACGAYVTPRYLKTAYGGRQGCLEAQSPGSAASSLRSLTAKIHEDEATASAVPRGGPYDGSKATATLIKQNGTWKVDGLKAHVPVGP
jgi:hypothetical protein